MALVCATALSRLIFGVCLGLILSGYTERDYLQLYITLALAFLVSFLFFDQEKDITSRRFRDELFRAFTMTILLRC